MKPSLGQAVESWVPSWKEHREPGKWLFRSIEETEDMSGLKLS